MTPITDDKNFHTRISHQQPKNIRIHKTLTSILLARELMEECVLKVTKTFAHVTEWRYQQAS